MFAFRFACPSDMCTHANICTEHACDYVVTVHAWHHNTSVVIPRGEYDRCAGSTPLIFAAEAFSRSDTFSLSLLDRPVWTIAPIFGAWWRQASTRRTDRNERLGGRSCVTSSIVA